MSCQTLLVERDGAVMTVRLNRPQKLNAINRQIHLDLQALCRESGENFETRAVILAGERWAFSSGVDTSEWGQPAPDNELELRHLSGLGSRTSAALESLDQITIAAVHGLAIGGAVVLALCCDLRIAGESAWFSIPEVELGMPLTWNALPRPAREVGHARALEVTVTCERFTARQTCDYGLVTHLGPDGEGFKTAREIVARIGEKPFLPVVLTKATMKAIRRGADIGDVSYSDSDLLLYTGLMQGRCARPSEGRAE
jgi:enoyl-CoA hydratase/carnithine racemase